MADLAPVAEIVRAGFTNAVGEAQLTAERAVCEQFSIDGLVPQCVVFPNTVEQVSLVLKCAVDHELAVVPCGGATGIKVGNPPTKYDIALCMLNIAHVTYYEPSDLTAGVGAGMRLDDFQNLLSRDGLWLPLDPPGDGQATIGGVVAMNASGPLRHFYGAPRDMVVGMRVATTDGKLIKTGGRVVKNVAGYDLGKLLIGSYGTLGVITEVNLKLFPLPINRRTFVLSAGTLGIARDLRRSILASPINPLRMVLLDAEAVSMVNSACQLDASGREPQIWLEAGGSKSVIDRTWKELDGLGRAVGAAVRAHDGANVEPAWAVISDFGGWLAKHYTEPVVLKATMPIASGEEFLSLAQQEAENEKVQMACVSQAGVGILYLGLLYSVDAERMAGLIGRIRKAAEEAGGALTLISALADVKARADVWGSLETSLNLMRRMKSVWDPKGILSPGRFVGSI